MTARIHGGWAWLVLCLAPCTVAADEMPAPVRYQTETLRGRVVWMHETLAQRFGTTPVAEARERIIALASPDGLLTPIFEDVRGRAFRVDKRLRGIDLELFVRRYAGSPLVQVIRVYEPTDQGKFELDYWCEICAIAMVELKLCDCCQGTTELRRQRVRETAREKSHEAPADQ